MIRKNRNAICGWERGCSPRIFMTIEILLILSVIFFISCSAKDDLLQVGLIAPSTNHLPLLAALEEDILSADEFRIHWFASGWEVNEALINGRIDLSIMPFTYAWQGISEGKDVRILSFLERESDGIIARKEIRNLHDLTGRKVGVLRASTLDVFFRLIMDMYDLHPEIIYFRTPTEMATALTSGHVDALSFYVPAIFQFSEDFHTLMWYSEIFPQHPCCDLVVFEKSLREKREQIKKFVAAMQESCYILSGEPDKGAELIVKHFHYDRETAKETLLQQKFITGLDEEGIEFQQKVIGKMFEMGYIRRIVPVDEVYYDINTETED